ncbi:MAG: S8/S53 family peptidase [Gammaproteobacteria bacterium]|nr:S8/S53 family peptidase [Gammaproteobacteria bacterium]
MRITLKIRLKPTTICFLALISANSHAQQVALVDSGVDPDAGFNIVGGFNYFNNTDDTSDVSTLEGEGHGTVSARLISDVFSGEIVPFVITEGTGEPEFQEQTQVARDSALSDILGRSDVRVVALTWGTSGITGSAAPLLPELSNANKVIAIMAGNDSASQPNTLATTSFNLSGVIIVGASDAEGTLLPDTNRAGTTADKYVVANGLPIEGAELGDASWSTARIAGIAGAVLLQNPALNASEVVAVILDSAEDRGDPGTDSEFGRGFIASAEQVLNNVMGPVTVPMEPADNGSTGSSGGGGGGGAGLLLGGALVGALVLLRKPKEKLEKTLVLDSYGRTFQLDLGDHIIASDEPLHLNRFFNGLQQASVSEGAYLPGMKTEVMYSATSYSDPREDMIAYFSPADDPVVHQDRAELAVALRTQLNSSFDLTAAYQVDPANMFGSSQSAQSSATFAGHSFISGQQFSSPLSGFGFRANALALDYQPGQQAVGLRLGLVSVNDRQRYGHKSFSSIAQADYEITPAATVSLQFGQLQEQGSLFGGAAGGVFGVKTATTRALNLKGNLQLSERWSLLANYGVGRTSVDSARHSLLDDFSDLSSDWYSVGIIGNGVLQRHDQMGFAVAQPLKIRSGSVNFGIPVARAANGDIAFDTERYDLADTDATEQKLEWYYRSRIGDHLEAGAFAAWRKNPNHVSTQASETLFIATLQYRL